MNNLLLLALDVLGTFAFALSGVIAAKNRNLDLFGVFFIAFITACGGGIIRDLCLGATPPVSIASWRYLFVTWVAVFFSLRFKFWIKKLAYPIFLFDAVGLGTFAVTGAEKVLHYGGAYETAIILGVITAVGGGLLRDVFLNRPPIILEKEIYASAALVGACIMVAGNYFGLQEFVVTLVGAGVTFLIRYFSYRYKWNLPRFMGD
ncbi:trimeric intracellular cation channel family protein [Advenella sp. RU8]|uniref:trimeric intracellular cation channel family protein n=1 Tax=Advenella sp. RU8 TaxID=3399575 RepID=UPI003AAB4145